MKWHEALEKADRSAKLKQLEKLLKRSSDQAPIVIFRVVGDKAASAWIAMGWEVVHYPTDTIYGSSHAYILTRDRSLVLADAEALR